MSHDYTIELTAERHLATIPAIEQAAAAIFSEDDLPADVRFLVTDKQTLFEAQRERRLWGALEHGSKVVGFALARVAGIYAHLEEMGEHPDHGRQGIGSELLAAVVGWARSCDLPGVTLITFRHLPWNAPFYERRGFVRLNDEDISSVLREFMREEANAGIEPRNRVAMYYEINDDSDSAVPRRPT